MEMGKTAADYSATILRRATLRGAAARNAVKTECRNGHPFDEANTRVRPDGARACRTCHRVAEMARVDRLIERKRLRPTRRVRAAQKVKQMERLRALGYPAA